MATKKPKGELKEDSVNKKIQNLEKEVLLLKAKGFEFKIQQRDIEEKLKEIEHRIIDNLRQLNTLKEITNNSK